MILNWKKESVRLRQDYIPARRGALLLRYYCFFHFARRHIRAYGSGYERNNEACPGRNKSLRKVNTRHSFRLFVSCVSRRRRSQRHSFSPS